MPSSNYSYPLRLPHWTDYVSKTALATVALSFPIATIAVFNFNCDRVLVSHILSVNFTLCLYIAFLVPFLRKHHHSRSGNNTTTLAIQNANRERRSVSSSVERNNIAVDQTTLRTKYWSCYERDVRPLHSVVMSWTIVSCFIHCSWELLWLIFHKQIRQGREDNNPLVYAWTAYIDGGDARYATDPISTLVYCLEVCSVINGFVGFTAWELYSVWKYELKPSKKSNSKIAIQRRSSVRNASLVLFTIFATYHLASCFIYFLSEFVEGCPNVNLNSWFDTYVKFFLVNSPWLVFPWFVLWWVQDEMMVAP